MRAYDQNTFSDGTRPYTSVSDAILANQKKPTENTGVTGKAQAFTGGAAEGIGADLPLMAIDYVGKKLVDKFGTDQMKQNVANAQPLTKQFEDVTHQTENPMTAGAGNIAGFAGGLVTGVSEAKVVPVFAKALEARKASKTASFVKDLITPTMSAKDAATAIKTGKVTEAGLTGSRDVSQAIGGFENIQKAVESVRGVSPKKTLLENANAIHDEIGTVAETLKSSIKDKGFFSPSEFKGYMNTVKTELQQNPTLVGDAEKTANKILTKFNSLVAEKGYTPSGLLEARKGLDAWMSSQKGNVFNPNTESAVTTALRAIRQGGNDFLAQRVPDVAVKELLAKQSDLYRAIENIAPKAAKEGGNALQRWVKAHPKIVSTAKYGLGLTGAGTAGAIIAK